MTVHLITTPPHSVSAMWAAVAPDLGNHLWQSTVFACIVWLLAVMMRKNQARARYWLWLTASVKFLIPFSLLVSMGSHLSWPHAHASKTGAYFAIEQASLPFSATPTSQLAIQTPVATIIEPAAINSFKHLLSLALMAMWLCGFVVVLFRWWVRWHRISATVREGKPLRIGREVEMLRRLERIEIGGVWRPIEMVASEESGEPGIFGITRPVLMWPLGISERLDDAHLQAILAHEICHVRRRDNLAAAMHMVVEAIFWFHPVVWWLGKQLVEERERACDERVLELYNRPKVYAESILKVCEFCVESPLPCVSGVTGSDLKKRIMYIMTEHVARRLSFGRKLLLAVTGSMAIAVPVLIGASDAPVSKAQVPGVIATVRTVPSATSMVPAIAMKALPMLAAVEPGAAPAWQPPAPPSTSVPSAATPTNPQDLSGTWQGTLQTDKTLRIVVKMSKGNGGWQTGMFSIDEGPGARGNGMTVLQGSNVKYSIPTNGGVYEGKLSADGASIVGTWTMNGKPLALTLIRVTDAAAWEVPALPPPPKPMAADANPSFEVATIKPSDPDRQGRGFRVNGRNFSTINTTLAMIMQFAYGVQVKQIVNGPDWLDKDKYDIAAVPDGEGQPNDKQWKSMLQKLLAERFQLKMHHDKRELSVYALTVAKSGPKMTKNESNGPLPSLFFRPTPGGIMLPAVNATMVDFAGVMQQAVLDRPIVDQTGITGRFDFTVTWEPDDSQFNGHPPPVSASNDPPPNLFTAIQQQVGLKLDPVKIPADVLVIDHVEKPSAN